MTITWKTLLAAGHTDILTLEAEVLELHALSKRPNFCALQAWYERIKPQILSTVGWLRRPKDSLMSTADAYDAVYQHLLERMPPCRHSGDCHVGIVSVCRGNVVRPGERSCLRP